MFLQVLNSLGHLSRSHVRFFSKAFSICWYDDVIFAFTSICKVYYSWLKYVAPSRDHWEKVLLIIVADLCNTYLHSACKYFMRILPLCSLVILTCISFCCSLCIYLVWVWLTLETNIWSAHLLSFFLLFNNFRSICCKVSLEIL